MDKKAIKDSIYQGSIVRLSEENYKLEGRRFLQDIAGEFIDAGDGVRAQIALMEVKRLDKLHNFTFK